MKLVEDGVVGPSRVDDPPLPAADLPELAALIGIDARGIRCSAAGDGERLDAARHRKVRALRRRRRRCVDLVKVCLIAGKQVVELGGLADGDILAGQHLAVLDDQLDQLVILEGVVELARTVVDLDLAELEMVAASGDRIQPGRADPQEPRRDGRELEFL
jgi:hypothetical protein